MEEMLQMFRKISDLYQEKDLPNEIGLFLVSSTRSPQASATLETNQRISSGNPENNYNIGKIIIELNHNQTNFRDWTG